MEEREIWVDNVKVVACILVVLGHLFQGLVKANVILSNDLYYWFNQTIYYFHVPLFFICSGYLYQKTSKVSDIKSWRNNIFKKLLNLGIPYFVFSIMALVLKKVFESTVNTSENGFLTTLFFAPALHYWYLYVLFFIFLITPTFKSKRNMLLALIIAIIMKLLDIFIDFTSIYAINGMLNNEIWFIIGMCLHKFNVKDILHIGTSFMSIIFIALSILVYIFNISFKGMSFLLGIIACASVISSIYYIFKENNQNKVFEILSKYNFPIFLMHTIFAAGFRVVLLKAGVTNSLIHIIIGIAVSFICPIIATWIISKTGFLPFLLYPTKYIKGTSPSI